MKYSNYLLIVLTILAFVTCKKESKPFNDNFIPVNNCRSFTVAGKTLNLCLDSVIQDSRCPVNAVCICAGAGVCRFRASSEGHDQVITLTTNKFANYNTEIMVEGFKIAFINLTPQAELEKPYNYKNYVAEVKVTRP